MSTELVETKSQLPALTEDELKLGTGQGVVPLEDLVLPRVQISAPKSKYTTPGKDAYIKGLELGQIFNTLTEQQYGKELFFVPIKYAGKNRTLFTTGLGVECRSTNGKTGGHISPDSCDACEFSQWGSAQEGNGSACTLFENFVIDVLSKGRPEMVMVSFKKKAIDAFKLLRTFIGGRIVPGTQDNEVGGTPLPMYRGKYRLGIAQANGKAGEYDLWSVKNTGEEVSVKDYAKVKADFDMHQGASFQKGEVDE